MIVKKCSKCNIEQPISEFHKQKTGKYGVTTICKSCSHIYRVNYYNENKERNKPKNKEYYDKNKEKLLIKSREWSKNNRDKINKRRIKRVRERRETDPVFKLSLSIRKNILDCFKRTNHYKNHKTTSILGCSFSEFRDYIESLWEPWMNWDNYGNPKDGICEPNKTWDLDHIIPINTIKNEEDIYKLNHYTNFQPLCSYFNRYIKREKIL